MSYKLHIYQDLIASPFAAMEPYFSLRQGAGISVFSQEYKLQSDFSDKNYSGIYAALRKRKEPYALQEMSCLLPDALECTPRAMETLLTHRGEDCQSLLVKAAAYCAGEGKEEHLAALLRQGVDPNDAYNDHTLLSIAAVHGQYTCVETLLNDPRCQPQLDRDLLEIWAGVDNGNVSLDFCIQAILPRVMDTPWNLFDPIPLPEGLRLMDAQPWHNMGMMLRLCQEQRIELEDAAELLSYLIYESGDLPQLLDALFTACPALLRRRTARQALVTAAVMAPGGVPEVLEPWLASIRGKQVILSPVAGRYHFFGQRDGDPFFLEDASFPFQNYDSLWTTFLKNWRQRMKGFPPPLLHRGSGLPSGLTWQEAEELLSLCDVCGPVKAGKVSTLAREVLQGFPVSTVRRELTGLLAQEDPGAMLAFCQSLHHDQHQEQRDFHSFTPLVDTPETACQYQTKVAILAGLTCKSVSYEL